MTESKNWFYPCEHMARTTAKLINHQNKITILNLIRQKGSISRAALAKETEMSAPTVTRIVDSLILSGLQ